MSATLHPHADREPWPVTRLKAIKPNQRVVYYRGACNMGDIEPSAATPVYADLLKRIFACAAQLEAEGRVTLDKVKVASSGAALFDFIAVGAPIIPVPASAKAA
jgi:hypothetical protein